MSSSPQPRVWLVVLAAALVLVIAIGTRTSFGLFLKPISAEFGWGRESLALALALQNLVWGLAQPFLSACADRFGSARVIAFSGLMYALGLCLMSISTTPDAFILSAGVLVGIALSGTGFPILLAVIGRRVPPARRGVFLGIGSAGGSSGQVMMVPAAQALITEQGWAGALLGMAVIALLIVPLAAALKGRAADAGEGDTQTLRQAVAEATAHPGFWLLTAGFYVCGFHVAFIGIHLPAYVSDFGLSPALGATALTVLGAGNIIGSLGFGYLGDRFRKKYLLSGLYFLRALFIGVFLAIPISPTSVVLFAFLIGLLWLGTVPLTSGLVADIFGPRYLATLFGVVFFSHQLGSFSGAWFGGVVYDTTGSYDLVWATAIALSLLAGLMHMPVRDAPVARLVPG